MQINGLQQNQNVQSLNTVNNAQPPQQAEVADTASSLPADQLDLSPESLAIEASSPADSSGIRMDKVAAIRQAIADGTYETPEKMSAALDKLLDTFA
ncbi:MAG: flagellar biosynthesis anti-sigma factor FlgM [Planctomycetota bacterium]